MLIDTHAHITSDELYSKIEQILNNAKLANVEKIVNICTDSTTLERGIKLAKKYPNVFNAGAITPHDVDRLGEEFSYFEKAAKSNQLIAIGETGLDYFYEHSPKDLQKEHLKRYFELALNSNLPVVIHCRDAFEDLFKLADEYYKSDRLVLHCFTGVEEEVIEATKRGWYISISGIVTFKRSESLREAAKHIPKDKLVIETDSPYLAPVPFRGKVNEPAYIVHTARFLADVLEIDFDELFRLTTSNAKRLFNL